MTETCMNACEKEDGSFFCRLTTCPFIREVKGKHDNEVVFIVSCDVRCPVDC